MKKTILVIDACVRREESRTKKLLEAALDTVRKEHPDWNLEILNLMDLDLMYWKTETLKERDELLAKKEYDAPVFKYGNQFREADGVIVAAPFWDLSIPAVLKVYIENISAEGITFGCNESGLYGLCKANFSLLPEEESGLTATWSREALIWRHCVSSLELMNMRASMRMELMCRNLMEKRFFVKR